MADEPAVPHAAAGGAEAPELEWDLEEDVSEVSDGDLHISDTGAYVPRALLIRFHSKWGNGVTHVRTATRADTGRVYIGKSAEGQPGAKPLRYAATRTTAEFAFAVPLAKLNVSLQNRRFKFKVFEETLKSGETVFYISLANTNSEPRGSRQDQAASGKDPAV